MTTAPAIAMAVLFNVDLISTCLWRRRPAVPLWIVWCSPPRVLHRIRPFYLLQAMDAVFGDSVDKKDQEERPEAG
jgi:hypothetical protein